VVLLVSEIVKKGTFFLRSLQASQAHALHICSKPTECGSWNKLSLEEIHQRSHFQKLEYVNAHMITLNVPYYVEHNLVQWLDGSNVRPNSMCPNRFPMRHSLKARKGEKLGQAGYADQDTPEKISEAVDAMSLWTNQLYVRGFIDQTAPSTNMYDVCADTEAGESNYAAASLTANEWTLTPINRIQESRAGNFVLFKFGWTAEQDVKRLPDRVEVTEIFHGTSPLAVVPIALARGLTALREDDGNHVESHIAEAATYFAPGPMSKNSWARLYADPSRLFADCDPQSAFRKVDKLSANNAACIRVYFNAMVLDQRFITSHRARQVKWKCALGLECSRSRNFGLQLASHKTQQRRYHTLPCQKG